MRPVMPLEALELPGKWTCHCFIKTGRYVEGLPTVTGIISSTGVSASPLFTRSGRGEKARGVIRLQVWYL